MGRYRVERRIGSGAFATVWLAHDEVLDAPVAVKVLADNWAHRLDVRSRFEEEARILRRADSDRVVRVHDIGELEDGRPYFVMTYADRGTLADRLAGGALPVRDALRYGADTARGLAVVHQVGVIHRDVNPGNLLLRAGRDGGEERVLIADLGLAKAAARGSGFTLTVGTPGYMAPEQARPTDAGIDRRADVYSIGAVVHHMLTGAVPKQDVPPAPPRSLRPELPEAVDAVVRQALSTRPQDRFPSAGALADALDAAALRAQEAPAPPRAVPWPPLSPALPRRAVPPAGQPGGEPGGAPPAGPADGVRAAQPAIPPAGEAEPPLPQRSAEVERPAAEAHLAAAERLAEPGPEDTLTLARPRPRRRRGRLVAVLVVVLLVLAGGGAAVAVARSRADVRVASADGTLQISVPRGWAGQLQRSPWDLTPYGVTGGDGIALAVAPDLARWRDPASDVPGVFVGRADGLQPADLLEAGPAADCPASPARAVTGSGLTGTVVRRVCAGSAMAWVEAVLQPPDQTFAVYVQVKEPATTDAADRVLSGLSVSWS